ncbi:uncharacterized protein LOC143025951 isoform X2 [Oratosquilla oratoria]|uniref:uncharacterized protein LOC143025951 isoform X2 n=1 Tax=Oratosquilla oratoria TaxID=337810 RepID=UPI003F76CC48
MYIKITEKLSHAVWRRILRRERRRCRRKRRAQARDAYFEEGFTRLLADPVYAAQVQENERLEAEAQEEEEAAAQRKREEWIAQDLALHAAWLRRKEIQQWQEEERKKQEELIRLEWEKQQEKEMSQEKRLLREAIQGLGEGEDEWHNPEAPAGSSMYRERPKGEACPFFAKTAACRFGVSCSREHQYPEESCTLLLPNMYKHLAWQQQLDAYDGDIALEYGEDETYQDFKDFYFDVLPEFCRHGEVIQFKVCCNTSPHLQGSVYVQYSEEVEAMRAVSVFNGRWYAGRQLSCFMVSINKWKSAICGLYWHGKCPKGGMCNFLHPFRNPGNAFFQADRDNFKSQNDTPDSRRSFRKQPGGQSVHRRPHQSSRSYRSLSRSPSPVTPSRKKSKRGKSRSRSPSRMKTGKYSRSPSRSWSRRRSRSRSRSRTPSRSRKKDWSLSRKRPRKNSNSSHKKQRKSKQSKSSRDRSRSRSRSESPAISKSKKSRKSSSSPRRSRKSRSRSVSPRRNKSKSRSPSQKRYKSRCSKSISPPRNKEKKPRNQSSFQNRSRSRSESPRSVRNKSKISRSSSRSRSPSISRNDSHSQSRSNSLTRDNSRSR